MMQEELKKENKKDKRVCVKRERQNAKREILKELEEEEEDYGSTVMSYVSKSL